MVLKMIWRNRKEEARREISRESGAETTVEIQEEADKQEAVDVCVVVLCQ